MEYHFLTEDEQHDTLVAFAETQERDHWMHTINKERYEKILQRPDLSAPWRERVQTLLRDTNSRIQEVTHILLETRAQFPAPEKVEAAKTRVRARQAAAQAAALAGRTP